MGDTDQNNQLQQNQNQGTLNHNVAGIAPSDSQGHCWTIELTRIVQSGQCRRRCDGRD